MYCVLYDVESLIHHYYYYYFSKVLAVPGEMIFLLTMLLHSLCNMSSKYKTFSGLLMRLGEREIEIIDYYIAY